jgi:hypothetical protein
MKTLFIIIAVIGLLMTIFTGFSYIHEKNIANIGPIAINKTESTPIYWSPITGIIILAVGVVGLAVSSKKRI